MYPEIILPALLGFTYIELRHVRKGMRKSGTSFSWSFYLRDNWLELLGNAIGTVLLLFTAPAVTHFLRYKAARWLGGIEDAALVDSVLTPVTGAAIGLLGAMFVRWVVKKGEGLFGGSS